MYVIDQEETRLLVATCHGSRLRSTRISPCLTVRAVARHAGANGRTEAAHELNYRRGAAAVGQQVVQGRATAPVEVALP